jgi:hypothetical protein
VLRLTYRVVSWQNYPNASIFNFGLIVNDGQSEVCCFSGGCISKIASLLGFDPSRIQGWVSVIEDRLKREAACTVASCMANEVVISEAYELRGYESLVEAFTHLKRHLLEFDHD